MTSEAKKSHRDTIVVEHAEVLIHQGYPGQQYVLRVKAPEISKRAVPGQFAHIHCGPELPLRRPLSFMRVDSDAGWAAFLYKVFGTGTTILSFFRFR